MAWLLLIPMLVSAALAQPGLHQSLWRDETATAIAITRSTGQLLDTLTNVDVSMTAYYLFMHAWSSVFGTSEIALRMPSLLAMIAAVGVVGLLGFRIASRSAGIVAASLMAVSPAAVRYSTEARPYALATLFVVVAAYVAHGPVRRAVSEQAQQASGVAAQTGSPRSVRRDLPWALIAALAVALHFLAIIAVLAQVFWLVGRRSRYAYALIPLATAFVLVVAVKGQASYQDWIQLPTAIGVLQSFVVLAGPAAVVLGFCGAVVLVVRRTGLAVAKVDQWVLIAWALLPALVLIVGSFVYKPVFITRYAIMSMPALALLAAVFAVGGFQALRLGRRWRWSIGVIGALVLLVIAAIGIAYSPKSTHEDLRGAADYIVANEEPGDGLIYNPSWLSVSTGWYLDRNATNPPVDLAVLGPSTPALENNLWPKDVSAPETLARVESVNRVWLVQLAPGQSSNWTPVPNVGGPSADYISSHWKRLQSQQFDDLEVSLWERRG